MLLEKLIVALLLIKLSAFHRTRWFITKILTVRHQMIEKAETIHTPIHSFCNIQLNTAQTIPPKSPSPGPFSSSIPTTILCTCVLQAEPPSLHFVSKIMFDDWCNYYMLHRANQSSAPLMKCCLGCQN